MCPNLDAEQARWGVTNREMAVRLGMSRSTYEFKKKTNSFRIGEIKKICDIFCRSFEYLFSQEPLMTDGDFL